jgi:hypothetical protein
LPASLVDAVLAILLTLPGPKSGTPPLSSTQRAEKLLADGMPVRSAARIISIEFGEEFEKVRDRINKMRKRRKRRRKPLKPAR